MGYNTSHYVSAARDGVDVTDEVLPALISQTGYTADHLLDGEQCKWYHEESDMLEVSRAFPDVVFRVEGYGEEGLDVWVHWFKNGLTQFWRLEVEIPPHPPEPWGEVPA